LLIRERRSISRLRPPGLRLDRGLGSVRTAGQMKDLADSLKCEGFAAAEVRVFLAHHALGDEELSALVAWWLGRANGT
jgi:hypothetical protein